MGKGLCSRENYSRVLSLTTNNVYISCPQLISMETIQKLPGGKYRREFAIEEGCNRRGCFEINSFSLVTISLVICIFKKVGRGKLGTVYDRYLFPWSLLSVFFSLQNCIQLGSFCQSNKKRNRRYKPTQT